MWKIYSCLKLNFAYTFQLTISTYFKHFLKVLSFRKLIFKQFHGMLMKLKKLPWLRFVSILGLVYWPLHHSLRYYSSLKPEFKGGIIIISQFLTQNSSIFYEMLCPAEKGKEIIQDKNFVKKWIRRLGGSSCFHGDNYYFYYFFQEERCILIYMVENTSSINTSSMIYHSYKLECKYYQLLLLVYNSICFA